MIGASLQDELSELSKRYETGLFMMQKRTKRYIVSVTRHDDLILVHHAGTSRYRARVIKQFQTEREFRRWSARVKLEPFEPTIYTQKTKS